MIGIKSIEFYIPDNLYPVRELKEVQELTPEQQNILSLMKLETVSIAEEYDNTELAYEASKKALTAAGITPENVDVVIYLQSRSPKYLMSSEATRLQELIGATNAYSFTAADMGCTNINIALSLARNILTSDENVDNILISCGSKPTGKDRYREAVTVIGDGGMGVVVSRCEANQLLDIKIKTDGRFWDLYKVEYKDKLVDEYKEICTNSRYKFELSIASRNNFKILNSELLGNNFDEVNGVIMQNLSESAFTFNEEALQVNLLESCFQNCRMYGHLGSIDIMLNYKTSLQNGEINKGDKVLIMNNSPVACWSSLLIKV